MNGTRAAVVLVIISLALAALVVAQSISAVIGGLAFAVALATLGIPSRGFRKA